MKKSPNPFGSKNWVGFHHKMTVLTVILLLCFRWKSYNDFCLELWSKMIISHSCKLILLNLLNLLLHFSFIPSPLKLPQALLFLGNPYSFILQSHHSTHTAACIVACSIHPLPSIWVISQMMDYGITTVCSQQNLLTEPKFTFLWTCVNQLSLVRFGDTKA